MLVTAGLLRRYQQLLSTGVLKLDVRATLQLGLSRLLSLRSPVVLRQIPQVFVHELAEPPDQA